MIGRRTGTDPVRFRLFWLFGQSGIRSGIREKKVRISGKEKEKLYDQSKTTANACFL
jgi:hypothetical protein